jgi:UDP-3-O-[3-hydroxymyristoyl] glucosamine N-acyltransferase
MKLKELASALGARLEPAGAEAEITGAAGIEQAGPTQLSFVANPKYAVLARTTKAAALIVAEDFPALSTPTLRARNPRLAFGRALELFYHPPRYPEGVHATAVVHESAKIGAHASLGAYVVVGEDVEIGDHCVLLPHVVIYRGARIGKNFFAHAHSVVREYCRLGDNVVLQNGAVIGCDGFGFEKDDEGRWHKIVQSGTVAVADDVEIQANSCVDRPSIGETWLGRGVKLDNLVQVGHSSKVGDDTLLCAQVGLAGSTEIGKGAILAGQAGVAGHCKIGDNVIITAQSGTHNDVPAGVMISGSPAIDHKLWLRCVAAYNKLPEIARALRTKDGGK